MEKNSYILTKMRGKVFSFLLDTNGRALEIHCDDENSDTLLGNIYLGRVKNVAWNLDAAFVDIAPGTTCYLPLKDAAHAIYSKKGASEKIQQGDELLVEVVRESSKGKFPSVTANLTVPGKYLLLTTGGQSLAASRKIENTAKQKLLADAREMLQDYTQRGLIEQPCPFGLLLRTNAAGAAPEVIRADFERLLASWQHIMDVAAYRTVFSCIRNSVPPYLKRLSDLYDDAASCILTEDTQIYEAAREYLQEYQPQDLPRLRLYEDRMLSLVKLYSLETQLDRALQERVWLDCGGYLVIQPTEALTVIDVNSGKYEGGKSKESAVLRVNLEAAQEIARQLRLRNLNGIIIIDFINMEEEESRTALARTLKAALREDPVQATFVGFTRLSLVELTRKKKERTLAELVQK